VQRRPKCTDPTHTQRGAANVCRICQAKYLREYRWRKKHGSIAYRRARRPKRTLKCTEPDHRWAVDKLGKNYCRTCRLARIVENKRDRKLSAKLQALCEEHVPLVRMTAVKLARRYGWLADLDELISIGLITMARVGARYDPAKGFLFWTFVQHRVNGEIFDAIQARRNYTHRYGIALDDAPEPLVEPSDDDLLLTQRRRILADVIQTLSPRDKLIVRALLAGETHAVIAKRLGVGESRVSQLVAKLFPKLQRACLRAA
jgi:RNA polymerase sigma factor (sigma-70 family)